MRKSAMVCLIEKQSLASMEVRGDGSATKLSTTEGMGGIGGGLFGAVHTRQGT